MTSERIKEIQQKTAYPESRSVKQALDQVWNECSQESYSKQQVLELMKQSFEAGFKKADIVEAGLEPKETEQEVNWILLKHKNK
jgi:hypothetical protein